MAWYYGTDDFTLEKLEKEFPVAITPNLRMSEDRKRLAVINDYLEGADLYKLADPKIDQDEQGKHIFYQTFFGRDAAAAKATVEAFLSETKEDGESILLLRRDPDRLCSYSHGHICTELLSKQAGLRNLLKSTSRGASEVFMLPLQRFMYRCPICGRRTLETRNRYDICDECGWEDEPWMEESIYDASSANHGFSMAEYRERYLHKKAGNPNYTWWKQFE